MSMRAWRVDRAHDPLTRVLADVSELGDLGARVATATRVLVLTGAGISVASGLPTFRGDGGIYGDGVPDFQQASALPDSVAALWAFWGPFRPQVAAALPNDAHHALAQWQERVEHEGDRFTLVTQNVDDLHQRAGSRKVAQLHGNLFATRCSQAWCPHRVVDDHRIYLDVPSCPACGHPLRPGMVLFGEQVSLDAAHRAKQAVRECDLFLAVGTSGTVSPASGLVRYARDVDALTVVVDPTEGDVSPYFEFHVRLPAEHALPVLLGR
jgi:NAD-dependent deacetylase